MELIVEDGSGVVGANSYVSLDFADKYFASHPYYADQWSDMDFLKRTGLLARATREIDILFNWYGYRTYAEQELDWPRQQVWYNVVRNYVAKDEIPLRVKEATCEMAFFISKGDPFGESSSEGLESLRIDVIELNFSNSTRKAAVPAAALTLLRGLGEYAYAGRSRKVLVG